MDIPAVVRLFSNNNLVRFTLQSNRLKIQTGLCRFYKKKQNGLVHIPFPSILRPLEGQRFSGCRVVGLFGFSLIPKYIPQQDKSLALITTNKFAQLFVSAEDLLEQGGGIADLFILRRDSKNGFAEIFCRSIVST